MLWETFGFEGVSQLADKQAHGKEITAGDVAEAGLEVATLGKGGGVLAGGKALLKGAVAKGGKAVEGATKGAGRLLMKQSERGAISLGKKLSPNQLNKLVKTGKAPGGIKRFDIGKVKGEQTHVHFDNGAALNIDGTWKHGLTELTRAQQKFLFQHGWNIPKP